MRCVLYLRMSKDTQDTSIADQRAAVTKHAAERGYRIIGEYVDEGISGDATEKRQAFQRLVADAVKKKFDLILCWDQDRFGRFDPIEGGFWIWPIRNAGVQLETLGQGRIDWSDFASRLLWTVTQEGKHAYLRDLAKNVTRGLRAAVERGVYPGLAPFGYRKENCRLVLGPEDEIAIVREIFRLKAGGMGYRTIAVRMANEGRPFPRARQENAAGGWTSNQVRYIINRRTYVGDTVYGGVKKGKYANIGEVIVRADTHPAIVSRDEWEAAQRTNRNSTGHCRNGSYSGALCGLLTCGLCGHVMYRFKYKDEYGYVCGTYHRSKGCGFCRVMDREILPLVAEKIRERVGASTTALMESLRRIAKDRYSGPDRKELERKVRDLDAQIERAAERLLAVDDAAVPIINRKIRELQGQRTDAAERLQLARPTCGPDIAKSAAALVRLPAIILGSNSDVVRAAIAPLVQSVVLSFRQRDRGRVRRFYELTGVEVKIVALE